MGELNERRWAVMSERGREASGLTYAEAFEVGRGLRAEDVSGVCLITDEAARRIPDAKRGAGEKKATARGVRRTRRVAGRPGRV